MARKKAAAHCKILPWLSAKGDNSENRFLQVGNSLLLDPRFNSLSLGARQTYICMCLDAGGKGEFTFPHGRAKTYNLGSRKFWDYIDELVKHGFISVEHNGNLRVPNVYRFTFEDWKSRPPPHD